jgi:hypothetical protein
MRSGISIQPLMFESVTLLLEHVKNFEVWNSSLFQWHIDKKFRENPTAVFSVKTAALGLVVFVRITLG